MKYLFVISVLTGVILAACTKEKPMFRACGERFYYYFNEKIFLEETNEKMVIVFSDTLSFHEMREILNQYKFIQPLQPEQVLYNVAMPELDRNLSCEKVRTEINKLKTGMKLRSVSLFLRQKNLYGLIGITNTFIVGLRDTADYAILKKVSQEYHSTILPQRQMGKTYLLTATELSPGDGLETANIFYETGKFEFAEPDMIFIEER